MCPRIHDALTGQPQSEVQFFAIRSKYFLGVALFGIVDVAITKFEEAKIAFLAVDVVRNAFQTSKQERLSHHIEVARKRIEEMHQMFGRMRFQSAVVGFASKRVVENFVEPFTNKLFTYKILQALTYITSVLGCKRRLQASWDFYVIVAVDAQDVFDNITGALYIHTIGGNTERELRIIFRYNLHIQGRQNRTDQIMSNFLADQFMNILVFQLNFEVFLELGRLYINNLHGNFTASEFFCQQSSLLQGIKLSIGIDTTLETERSIGIESMTSRALSYPCRVEISTFKQDIARRVVRSATLSTEHSGDTHRLFGIANGQVALRKFAFFAIERDKRRAFRKCFHHNLATFDHICIEAMQGLSVGHHHIVRDVDNIIDGSQTDGVQFVLQPLGALFDFAAFERNSTIAQAGFWAFYFYSNGQITMIYGELSIIGAMQGRRLTIAHEIGIKITRNSPVRASICTVGRDIYFNQEITFETKISCSGRSYRCVDRQDHNPIVSRANTDLIFGANHTVAFDTTQLRLLNDEFAITIVEFRAECSNNYFLTGGHIMGTAHHLRRFVAVA